MELTPQRKVRLPDTALLGRLTAIYTCAETWTQTPSRPTGCGAQWRTLYDPIPCDGCSPSRLDVLSAGAVRQLRELLQRLRRIGIRQQLKHRQLVAIAQQLGRHHFRH